MIKKGFTLIELLVVIAVIALLLGILLPVLARARERARIVAANAEIRQIGLALENYFYDHQLYPPTREDCNTGSLDEHLYQLPSQLADQKYLPSTDQYQAMSTTMEDRFNPGTTYKYRAVGQVVRDRNIISRWFNARLWVPNGFPGKSSLDARAGRWHDEPRHSPVRWTLFSLGPDLDRQRLNDKAQNRYPVPKELWYDSGTNTGLLVRIQLRNGTETGTF